MRLSLAVAALLCLGAEQAAATPRVHRMWRSLSAEQKTTYAFEDFLAEFAKEYTDEATRAAKAAAFGANLQKIHAHNAGSSTWTAGVNTFADLTPSEFRAVTKGRSWDAHSVSADAPAEETAAPPVSVDWRTKTPKVVTPVKNQGGCGSCWAFSATESIESALAIATGKLLELAPQEFVDCVLNPDQCGGTGGCEGATAELAFNYTMSAGMALAKNYRYKGSDGKCRMGGHPNTGAMGIKGFVKLPPNDQSALLSAVATKGPISISVDASSWQVYERGIFSDCNLNAGVDIDHAVQLMGYGPEYYLVRNSWGAGWGEEGYIRIKKLAKEACHVDNKPGDGYGCKNGPKSIQVCGPCGILADSSYPTGAFLKSNTTQ